MTGPLVMLIGGGAALAYVAYDWLQYKMRVRLRRDATVEEKGVAQHVSYDWRVWVMFIATLLIAFLYARPITRETADPIPGVVTPTATNHAYLIAIYITVVGFWWAIRQARKAAVSRRLIVSDEVQELVHQFRSVFRIRPTVFSALEESNRKIEPPVGNAVSHAVTTFYVTSLPRRAFDELRHRIDNPYMDQFIYILERGEDARHEDILDALDGLLLRLRRARDIRDHSEVNMTVLTGQTRIIQLIAVTLITVVGVIPMFRAAYESAPGQLLFILIASVGVLTSWYIDRRSTALKERVL
jgi:hypothetical protein